MGYVAWSVVFGEQPSASKWNILGQNDASFADGTGISADVITDSKLIYGKLRKRQGGSATNWNTAGTNNYDYDAVDVFMQAGSQVTSGGSSLVVTFPATFNQVPIVVATVTTASGANAFARISAVTTSNFTVQLITDAGAGSNNNFNWIAIGE